MKRIWFMISLYSVSGYATVDRIQSLRFDRGRVKEIFLAPGLGSMIQFPCSLQEAFVGRNQELMVQISPSDKKVLFLNLKLNSSLPTNVIVRCEGERNSFVFDVFPSKAKHQDIVDIRSSFGGPGIKDLIPISAGETKSKVKKVVLKKPELVNAGVAK